jgi:hypothetical protein
MVKTVSNSHHYFFGAHDQILFELHVLCMKSAAGEPLRRTRVSYLEKWNAVNKMTPCLSIEQCDGPTQEEHLLNSSG